MNTKIYTELMTLRRKEKELGVVLPKPYFLFVENYGRNITGEMNEISGLLGKTTWFTFDLAKYDETYCEKLKIEVDKAAMLGKEYEGCILLCLPEDPKTDEAAKIMEYIQAQNGKIIPVFSMMSGTYSDGIKQLIDSYHFCRVIEGEPYTEAEQLEILKEELAAYGFHLKNEAKISSQLKDTAWGKEDEVENILRNVARKMVYEKVLNDSAKNKEVDSKSFADAFEMQEKKEPVRVIGFAIGGC